MSGWKSTKDGKHFRTRNKPGINSNYSDHSNNSGTQPSSLHQPIPIPSKSSDWCNYRVTTRKAIEAIIAREASRNHKDAYRVIAEIEAEIYRVVENEVEKEVEKVREGMAADIAAKLSKIRASGRDIKAVMEAFN